jgi:hypothetical protein
MNVIGGGLAAVCGIGITCIRGTAYVTCMTTVHMLGAVERGQVWYSKTRIGCPCQHVHGDVCGQWPPVGSAPLTSAHIVMWPNGCGIQRALCMHDWAAW